MSSAIVAGAGIAGSPATVAQLADAIDAVVALRPLFVEAARRIHGGRRIVTTGLGADFINARELALKIEEGARIPANAHRLETVLHGHLAGCDADPDRARPLRARPARRRACRPSGAPISTPLPR